MLPLLELNTRHLELRGEEVNFGSKFSEDSVPNVSARRRQSTAEGHGRGKSPFSFHSRSGERRKEPGKVMEISCRDTPLLTRLAAHLTTHSAIY